ASLPGGRAPTRADWGRLSQEWRPRLDAQIERLQLLRDNLDGCIGCGCLSLARCTLQNPDDVVSPRGPGAVYLEPGGE
ncbi:MAG: MerR family DNA-binding protein, partial [Gemmatimonadales bacterium]